MVTFTFLYSKSEVQFSQFSLIFTESSIKSRVKVLELTLNFSDRLWHTDHLITLAQPAQIQGHDYRRTHACLIKNRAHAWALQYPWISPYLLLCHCLSLSLNVAYSQKKCILYTTTVSVLLTYTRLKLFK